MRRRPVLQLLGVLVASPANVAAQSIRKLPLVGFLGNSTAVSEANLLGPFRDGLRDLGYVEGRDIAIEYRWAEGDYRRFPALVAELLVAKVDVIVTAGTPAAQAVLKATSKVPLVMVAVGDPVGNGLVATLARPGRNATGLTSIAPELEGKRMELIKEVLPGVSRVAALWNPGNAYMAASERQAREAASLLHISIASFAAGSAAELQASLAAIRDARPDALLVLADRLFLHNRNLIAEFTASNRLPSMNAYRELVEAGGLMSFGPSYAGMHRQAARYVAKILAGANPAELPVEQPAKFEFILNLKTARTLRLNLPEALVGRADEVIE